MGFWNEIEQTNIAHNQSLKWTTLHPLYSSPSKPLTVNFNLHSRPISLPCCGPVHHTYIIAKVRSRHALNFHYLFNVEKRRKKILCYTSSTFHSALIYLISIDNCSFNRYFNVAPLHHNLPGLCFSSQ